MLQLLFMLVIVEGMVVSLMIVKNPFRKPVIESLDWAKRDQGPVVFKIVIFVMFMLMVSGLNSILKIQRRSDKFRISPTDEILASRLLLEAALMGFSIFLLFVADRVHHYIRELRAMRKTVEPLKKQIRNIESKTEEIDELEKEISVLKERVKQLEADAESKDKEAKHAEENAMVFKKQSDGFLLEYDRLLEDNQNLRTHLKSFERRLSRTDSRRAS